MNRSLSASTKLLQNSQHSPEIRKEDYPGLPRIDRIYYAIMYPRYFQMTNADEDRLELMKRTYNILIAASTDQQARNLIKVVRPGPALSTSDVLELIRETKEFFGKIEIRDITFDRAVMRHRLLDLYTRAKLSGDIWNERLALKQLTDLDALAVKDPGSSGTPVIPELPDIKIVDMDDAAIIISKPHADEEE